jgi:putative ABC transport system substrate-binding protein
MAINIARRKFITAVGGTAFAWPLAARAQQPAVPVIGFLHGGSPDAFARQVAVFKSGLGEAGYVEGRSVVIEYRWAEGHLDRLPAMADDLVRRHVAVIVTTALPAALAARAATATIPIVFQIGGDPVTLGLVDSLNRPGANITGVTQLSNVLAPKQFEILHDVVPNVSTIGTFINKKNPNAAYDESAVQAAAQSIGLQLRVFDVTNEPDLDATFATIVQEKVGALLVGMAATVGLAHDQIIASAQRLAIPAIYPLREDVVAGGLMSYGADFAASYRQVAFDTGKILKGAKPAELPVQQATKVEFVINLRTAKALGLTIPLALLGRADEVIE